MKLKILLTLGFCQFAFAQNFTENTASGLTGVFYGDAIWADLNADQKPEIILSGAEPGYSGFLSAYEVAADSFTPISGISYPIMYTALAAADLNADGHQDFIATGTRTGDQSIPVFYIFYNNGNGSFTVDQQTGITPANFGSVNIADLNQDGRPDILVNGQGENGYLTKIYSQTEEGTFQEEDANLMGTYFSDTKIFDANADGLPDILVTGFNTSYVPDTLLYLNNGNFSFTEIDSGLGAVYFSSIDVADVNGDGSLDVLLSGMDSGYVASLKLYYNDGSGNFTPSGADFSGSYSGSARLVDYDNDGNLDVFVIGLGASGTNEATFYHNDGSDAFSKDQTNSDLVTGLNMSRAEFADYDLDGDQDLLVIGYDGTNGIAKVYTNITPATEVPVYCEVSVDWDVEPITRVVFAGIDNQTAAGVNATAAYEDFTSISGLVNRGETYEIAVEGNTVPPFEHDIRIFIDWNQDGNFDMETEYYWANLTASDGTDGVQATTSISVPDDAALGTTRLRIIKDMWNVYEPGEFDACLNAYYGQVEDYSLNVETALSNNEFAAASVSIYPNPASENIYIQTQENLESAKLYNLHGQLLLSSNQKTIGVSHLPTGLYTLSVSLQNGARITRKIIRK